MGCDLDSISCSHEVSNGKQNCLVESSNCQMTHSNGHASECKQGEFKKSGLGGIFSSISLDPGYEVGLIRKAPQQVCVSPSKVKKRSKQPSNSSGNANQ